MSLPKRHILGDDEQQTLDDLAQVVYFYRKLIGAASQEKALFRDAAACCCSVLQLLIALSNNHGVYRWQQRPLSRQAVMDSDRSAHVPFAIVVPFVQTTCAASSA